MLSFRPSPPEDSLALLLLPVPALDLLLIRGRELGLDFAHAALELRDPLANRASDLRDALRPEDEQHDQEEPEQLLGAQIEHRVRPSLEPPARAAPWWSARLGPAPCVTAHDDRDIDHFLGTDLLDQMPRAHVFANDPSRLRRFPTV